MRADKTGIVVARGIGIGLIVLGICSGVGNFMFFEPVTSSGWTSYSPLATSATVTSSPSTSFSYAHTVLWLPSVAQLIAGSAFILFGKRIGAWLARGLDADEQS